MATFIRVDDKRNTSKGMTPNKSIRRPSNPPIKKALSYRKQGK